MPSSKLSSCHFLTMYEDVIPENSSHFDSLPYIRIDGFGNDDIYEYDLKSAIYECISYNGEVIAESLKQWIKFYIAHGQETVTEVDVFEAEESFNLQQYATEVQIFGASQVSPFRSIFYFSSKGKRFVVYLCVVTNWIIEFQQWLQQKIITGALCYSSML